MSYQKIARLVTALSEKTITQEVSWNQTEHGEIFETSFPNYSVRISKGERPNNFNESQPIYILEILNDNGEIVEEIDDEMLTEFIHSPFGIMKEMYEAARRQAMGVEEALDSILNIIDPIPF